MKTVYSAIRKVRKDLKALKFNKSVKYKAVQFRYADLKSIMDHLDPACEHHGVGYLQRLEGGALITEVFDDNDMISSSYDIPPIKSAQDLGSWITYIKRYQLAMMFGVVAEADNDANKSDKVEEWGKLISNAENTKVLTSYWNKMSETDQVAFKDQFTAKRVSLSNNSTKID